MTTGSILGESSVWTVASPLAMVQTASAMCVGGGGLLGGGEGVDDGLLGVVGWTIGGGCGEHDGFGLADDWSWGGRWRGYREGCGDRFEGGARGWGDGDGGGSAGFGDGLRRRRRRR